MKSRKLIGHLFSNGESLNAPPIKLLYDVSDNVFDLKAGVTVSSRNFKKATDRNKIKRLLREAYRLQKLPLQQFLLQHNKAVALFFIYTGKEIPLYNEVDKSMQALLQRLLKTFENLSER